MDISRWICWNKMRLLIISGESNFTEFYTTSIRSSHLLDTLEKHTAACHTRIILGNTIRRAGTDFVFIFNLLIPVRVNKVVTYNWIALLLIKSKSWKWKSLAVPLQNSFLLLTANVQIWRFGWEGLTVCFFCELCYRVHLCRRLNWIKGE